MKPPTCCVCGAPLHLVQRDGQPVDGLVQFADHRPVPDGMPGHPHGLDWFCERHFGAARRLAGGPMAQALAALARRRGFGLF